MAEIPAMRGARLAVTLAMLMMAAWLGGVALLAVSVGVVHCHRPTFAALLLISGCFLMHRMTSVNQPLFVDTLLASPADQTIRGTVQGVARYRDDTVSFRVKVPVPEQSEDSEWFVTWRSTQMLGPCEIYDTLRLATGDEVSLRGEFRPTARDERRKSLGTAEQFWISAREVKIVRAATSLEAYASHGSWWAQRRMCPLDHTGVLRALTLGATSELSTEWQEHFILGGIAHVLAVSGMHLTLLAAALAWMCQRVIVYSGVCRGPRVWPDQLAIACTIPLTWIYCLLCGSPWSLVRAALAFSLLGLTKMFRRNVHTHDVQGVVAVMIVCIWPAALFDPGFLLSVVACYAITLSDRQTLESPEMPEPGLSRYFAQMWAATWRATLATAPITWFYFGTISTAGLVANFFAVPLIELLALPMGLLGILAAIFSLELAEWLWRIAFTIASLVDWLGATLSRNWRALAGQDISVSTACALLGFVLTGMAFCHSKPNRKVLQLAAISVLGFAGHSTQAWLGNYLFGENDEVLSLKWIDVGQGDATLIDFPDGSRWLVDGGGQPNVPCQLCTAKERMQAWSKPGQNVVVPLLADKSEIDVVLLSHPHPDHYAGLFALLGNVRVKEFWLAAPMADAPWPAELSWLVGEFAKQGTTIVFPASGYQAGNVNKIWLGSASRRANASPWLANDPLLSGNDNSLALLLQHAGRRVLLAGDAELEAEQILLPELPDLAGSAIDVAKVSHHGSDTSSNPEWIRSLNSSAAIVSSGRKNQFHHPSPSIVSAWQKNGTEVWRTDLLGDITLTINGDGELKISSQK